MCLVYYNENLWKYVEEISIFLYIKIFYFLKNKDKKIF